MQVKLLQKTFIKLQQITLHKVHIPKSDVFYVREAIYQRTGEWYTLDHVERAMYLEGHLQAYEVLDPKRKREYGE